jgi:hypothetical protein
LDIFNMLAIMDLEAKSIETLRRLAVEHIRVSGRTPSSIWSAAARDANFLRRVESGRSFSIRTMARALLWFSDNWPALAVWPADIERPGPSSAAKSAAAE